MKVVKQISVMNATKELHIVTFNTNANVLIHMKKADHSIKDGITLSMTAEQRFQLIDEISNAWVNKPLVSKRLYTSKESYMKITYCKHNLKEFIKFEIHRHNQMEVDYEYDKVTLTKEQSRTLFRALRGA